MNALLEFAGLIALYMFLFSYLTKRMGGRELVEIDKEIRKVMEKVRKGDREAFSKLNQLNARRMRIVFRSQLYFFPFIILFFLFLKHRYANLSARIFGIKLGWFGLFLLIGLPLSFIMEKITSRVLSRKG